MFHRPSLLMTGIILMMGMAWFGMHYYFGDSRAANAETSLAESGER